MLKYAKGRINMKYICTLSHKFDSRIEITILRVYAPTVERFHDYGKGFIRFAMI